MRRRFLQMLAAAPFALAACDAEQGPARPAQPGATPEALARKARSEARLKGEAVPVNASLPVIESEAEAMRRPVDAIAGRALSLLVVAAKAVGAPADVVARLEKDCAVENDLSPEERAFLALAAPDQQQRSTFSWRYEGAWTLLWALGYAPALARPDAQCDVDAANRLLKDARRAAFVAGAKPRPMAEILDAADLIYRYDWAAVDARVKRQPAPAGLVEDVIVERHKALNWLIGYGDDAPWDGVTTDT